MSSNNKKPIQPVVKPSDYGKRSNDAKPIKPKASRDINSSKK